MGRRGSGSEGFTDFSQRKAELQEIGDSCLSRDSMDISESSKTLTPSKDEYLENIQAAFNGDRLRERPPPPSPKAVRLDFARGRLQSPMDIDDETIDAQDALDILNKQTENQQVQVEERKRLAPILQIETKTTKTQHVVEIAPMVEEVTITPNPKFGRTESNSGRLARTGSRWHTVMTALKGGTIGVDHDPLELRLPAAEEHLKSSTLEKLCGEAEWKFRQVVLTELHLFLSKESETNISDSIPLHEITEVAAVHHPAKFLHSEGSGGNRVLGSWDTQGIWS